MTTRRQFLGTTGAAVAGAAIGTAGNASAAQAPTKFKGMHEMPRNMTLLSIANKDGSETLGVKTEKGVIDVRAASKLLGMAAPATLEELLKEGNAAGLNKLVAACAQAKAKPALLDESKITHGRLFTNPSKIVCVGLNYRRHAKEVGMQEPRVPILFNKYNNSLAGQNCTITLPPKDVAYKFDYETELLIVIGKPARNVSEADALKYVAGYCTSTVVSARDLPLELPAFVSADIVGDPNNLKIETRVNGEVRQSWSTNDFIFNTQQMVSYISKFWTLEPGDIIFTGTPQGVIAGMPKDKQVWLKAGDEIVSSIEKLGDLKFRLA